MRNVFFFVLGGIVGAVCVGGLFSFRAQQPVTQLLAQPTPVPTPLAVYSFDHLAQTQFPAVPIVIGTALSETDDIRSQEFTYSFAPNPSSPQRKQVSGVITTPKEPGMYPVIVMFRGYVPLEKYFSGAGTNPSATVYARHGFITLAPDFLGYGQSASRSADPYEARFQTYTTALSLLASLPTLNTGLDASYSGSIRADISHVGIWGHSNGGHIALATLAISKLPYPTVLWAPVSKTFPYSVLAYTDEDDDGGKAERKDLAHFETIYDTAQFDPAHYYGQITAPLQVHQGTADEEVPVWWTNEFVKTLKDAGSSVEYHVYPGADHNLRPAWNDVVTKSVDFYTKKMSTQ